MVQEARSVQICKKADRYNDAAQMGAVSISVPAVTIAGLVGDVSLTSTAAAGTMGIMAGAGGGKN